MSINKRIRTIMDYYGLNKNSFTNKVGASSPSVIGKILNDENRKPSFDIIEKIVNAFPDINADWLISGKGTMFHNPPDYLPEIHDRIMKIMNTYNLNWQRLAKRVGVKMPSRVMDVVINRYEPEEELLEGILKTFPQVNRKWLYNNDGKMLKDEVLLNHRESEGIKYFTTDVNNEVLNGNQYAGIFHLDGFKDCTVAVNVVGNMMVPDLQPGEIVLCKPMDKEDILNGLMYLIITDSYAIIRKVNKENDKLSLISSNSEYDPMIIDIDKVRALYAIKGRINKYLL